MIDIKGKLRAYSKVERGILASEVLNATDLGYDIADKVRRFCSFHRNNIPTIALSRFGKDVDPLSKWMFQILYSACVNFAKNEIVKIDAAYLSALFFLIDNTPNLADKRPELTILIDSLYEQLSTTRIKTNSDSSEDQLQFFYENWSSEIETVGKILIFCPNPFSLYTSLVIQLCVLMNIPILGVVVRKFTFSRMLFELKRDGFFRMIKKIFRKLILRTDENSDKSVESQKKLHDAVVGGPPNVNGICKLHGISLLEVNEFTDCLDWLEERAPDAAIFTGGGMMSKSLLDKFSTGVLNIHMGALPKYKGMDVVQAQILESDRVCLTAHIMAAELDTGPIVQKFDMASLGYESLGELRNTLTAVIPILAIDSLLGMFSGRLALQGQLQVGRQYYVMHPVLIKLSNDVLLSHYRNIKSHGSNTVSPIISALIKHLKDNCGT